MKKILIFGMVFLFLVSGLSSSDFDLLSPKKLAKELKNPNSKRMKAAVMQKMQIEILANSMLAGRSMQPASKNESKVRNFILEYKINELEQHPKTAWIYSSITGSSLIDFEKMGDFVVSRSFNIDRFKQAVETMKRSIIDLSSFIKKVVNSTKPESVPAWKKWSIDFGYNAGAYYQKYKKRILEHLIKLQKRVEEIDADFLAGKDPYQNYIEKLPKELRDVTRMTIRAKEIGILLDLWKYRARGLYSGSWYESGEKIELALKAVQGVFSSDIKKDIERFKKLIGPLMKKVENGINELIQDVANLRKIKK